MTEVPQSEMLAYTYLIIIMIITIYDIHSGSPQHLNFFVLKFTTSPNCPTSMLSFYNRAMWASMRSATASLLAE